MEGELVEVLTTEDHLCGRCGKWIHKGTQAFYREAELLDGREEPITTKVFYHPKCQPLKPQQIRKPYIDPRVAKKKGRRWWRK